MRDPRINFRNRELAALLAFLIPGAGHFYQGRTFKAGVYCTGILFLFFAGMILGDWQPVYSQVCFAPRGGSTQMQPRESKPETNFSIGYGAQVFLGLPAIPSLIQQARFSSDDGVLTSLNAPINSSFSGILQTREAAIPVTGKLTLQPGQAGSGEGTFTGETQDGQPVNIDVNGAVDLGQKVFGSPRRDIVITGITGAKVQNMEPYAMQGTIPRSFIDWYQAPRDNAELDRLHGKLSQNFDIASVFTWIAGLLNLMAIWDAYDGPAYGYGDEEPEEDDDSGGNS